MENFFKYISKPIPSDDVDVWFKINNIIPEKMELFSDFSYSLNMLIVETYLGENNTSETKIVLSNEDVEKHFQWCFNKVIDNFSTLEKIKTLTEELSMDTTKFFKGNNSAGTRARKLAQEIKTLLQNLRNEILDERKKTDNE